jgi:hypothetical protein
MLNQNKIDVKIKKQKTLKIHFSSSHLILSNVAPILKSFLQTRSDFLEIQTNKEWFNNVTLINKVE